MSDCIAWTGRLTRDGYGTLGPKAAHRLAYEQARGPIPEGLTIDHLCRNRSCVNPDHLEAVTHRENVLRGFSPPALHARKTHCSKGHEFTPENTYVLPPCNPNGAPRRQCRACNLAAVVAYKRRRQS